jgi:hypothetical protein
MKEEEEFSSTANKLLSVPTALITDEDDDSQFRSKRSVEGGVPSGIENENSNLNPVIDKKGVISLVSLLVNSLLAILNDGIRPNPSGSPFSQSINLISLSYSSQGNQQNIFKLGRAWQFIEETLTKSRVWPTKRLNS